MIKPMFFMVAAMVAAPVLAQTPALPMCSAKVTDGCQQTPAQQARAMTGAQADKRDAAHGGKWTPDMTGTKMASDAAMPAKPHKKAHHKSKKTVTKVTTTTTAPPQ